MTLYRFRLVTAAALFALLAFAVLAFGAVDVWARMVFELGAFVLAAVWIGRLALTKSALEWNPFYVPLGLAVAWTAAQYALGLSVDSYRTREELLKWLALGLLFAVACQCFADESIRKGFSQALLWFGFALCVFGVAQHFTSTQLLYWSIPLPAGRPFGPFVNGNHFAAFMELLIPAALTMALRRSEQQMIYAVVFGVMVAAVVLTGSRAGAGVVAAESLVVLGVHGWRRSGSGRRGRRVWLPVAGLAAAAAIAVAVAGAERLRIRFEEENPYGRRWEVVRATWRLFLQQPGRGYGAGVFSQVYPSASLQDDGRFWSHAHNDPLQFLLEWGVAGLAVMGGMLTLLLRRRWPRAVWLNVVLPAGAVLVHSWFDFPLQIPAVLAAWLLTVAQAVPATRGLLREAAPAMADLARLTKDRT